MQAVIMKGREHIRVRLEIHKGHYFFDVRVWEINEDMKMVPTTNGINIPLDLVSELAEAVKFELDEGGVND